MDYFFRNGEGDEVIFVHEGRGTLETIFGDVPYKDGDYVVIPRGTTYRFVPRGRPALPRLRDAGADRDPRRYRNQYGQILEGAPYYHRDIHPPDRARTRDRERGEFLVKVRVRGGYQDYVLDYHPFDVVGWDGFLYPWTFSIHDFEPITGRIHQPPPSHQTFQGPNFVICSFCPRKLDFDPEAVPIPYHHSNLQSEEMIYYVSGNFGSRKGISVGCDHPSPVRAPARAAAGPRREVARRRGDHRARRDVRHVPAAQALDVRARPRRRTLRAVVVRAAVGGPEPRGRDEPPSLDADRFLRELPRLFEDFPRSEHPRDRRFAPIVDEVENLARENILALLNLAASLPRPGRGLRRGRRLPRREPHRGDARERGAAVRRHRQLRVPRRRSRRSRRTSRATASGGRSSS